MQNSLLSTRSFLRKSFHRRQKSTESQASSKVDTPSAAPEWKEERRPSHDPIVEKELAIVQDPDEPSTPRRSDETMKAMVKADTIFKGLPDCSLGMDRYGSFMDDENLKVFGITMDDTASIKGSGRRGQKIGITMTPPMESTVDGTFEMDVPVYAGRDRRPDLQVSIPTKRTPPSRSPQQGKRQAVNTPSSTMSTPSTLKTGQTNKSLGMTSTPISIVSPLSVVEMPKPKRPFSTVSIEGMANGGRSSNTLAPQVKSADSMSSDDTGDMGGKSSGLSARSSMSSVDSDIEVFQALEVRRPSKDSSTQRFDSTSLYHASLAPISPKYPRGNFPPKPFAKPVVQRQGSYSSLRTTSTINVNKPLPPEPGRSGSIPDNRSLFGGGSQTPSRSSSITIRQPMFPRRTGAEHQSSPSIASIQRRDSKGSISKFSLNSKYTPKDLDALDEAFSQHRPSAGSHPLAYSVRSTPSQSQVSLVIENGQLGTITEHTIHNSRNGPVQISRGPMRMEPSRRPPLPPTQVHRIDLPAGDKPEQRKRSIIPRSQSSNHLNAQVKDNAFNPKRSITVGSGSSKAHRILGQSNLSTSISHEVPKVPDPIRKVTDTSQDISRSSSPASSRGGDHTPELEGRADVHVEEIRRRLELLRPTEDPSATFLAVHQLNAARSAEKLRLEEKLMQAEPFKNEINMPAHIAELEAYRTPSPVELPASLATPPAELGLPSPLPTAEIPIPPEPSEGTGRRGRVTNSSTQSTVSGKFHSLHSQRSYKARSLASLAASEIPDIYADLPTSNSSLRPSMTAEEVEQLISADAAERVLLHILESLDNLEDLFAASMVSRGFYRTFKRHELDLLKRAVWRMSPAAWELREMSAPCSGIDEGSYQYTPNLYFRHYVQDLLTMVELKAMILDHCRSFLRPKTISGLAGETERSPMIDEAFWRVWTFCSIFGCGKNREDDIVGQMDWLRGGLLAKQSTDTRTLALTDQLARNSVLFNPPPGFAKGNGKGLTAEELYDMNEIWICLGVLVRGYQGKRKEAREYGIFDNAGIPAGDAVKEDAILGIFIYPNCAIGANRLFNRGVDLSHSHPRSSDGPGRYVSRYTDPVLLCSGSGARLHLVAAANTRLLQVYLSQGSRFPRLRRENRSGSPLASVISEIILQSPSGRQFYGLSESQSSTSSAH